MHNSNTVVGRSESMASDHHRRFQTAASAPLSRLASLRKWIFDTYACDPLSRVQIFREDPGCAGLQCSGNNESIPESDLGFILDPERRREFRRAGLDTPDCVRADDEAGRFFRQRMYDLPCDINIEFLQHLQADDTSALAPELGKKRLGHMMLG